MLYQKLAITIHRKTGIRLQTDCHLPDLQTDSHRALLNHANDIIENSPEDDSTAIAATMPYLCQYTAEVPQVPCSDLLHIAKLVVKPLATYCKLVLVASQPTRGRGRLLNEPSEGCTGPFHKRPRHQSAVDMDRRTTKSDMTCAKEVSSPPRGPSPSRH